MFKPQETGSPGSQMRSRWAMFVQEPPQIGPGISMFALRSSVCAYNQQPGVFPAAPMWIPRPLIIHGLFCFYRFSDFCSLTNS